MNKSIVYSYFLEIGSLYIRQGHIIWLIQYIFSIKKFIDSYAH